MATIYPIRAIRPNDLYADQLVFTNPQTGIPPSLKVLLESGARQRPETPEGQATAYQDVRDTLRTMLEGGCLAEEPGGLFIYEVISDGLRQTGVWTMTALEDYTRGRIRTHEHTFADSVRRLKNYREHTGLEGSPVLLTYVPDATINCILAYIQLTREPQTYRNGQVLHRLWKISDEVLITRLTKAFADINKVYLADGHHRLESAALLAGEQLRDDKTAYTAVSSLYIATDQLQIKAYHRVVLPEKKWDRETLLAALSRHYYIQEAFANKPVLPQEKHLLGMRFGGAWYHLAAKPHTYQQQAFAAQLDTAILQREVFAPVFGISDPKNDPRLKHAGGDTAAEEIETMINNHPHAVAFTLSPLSAADLLTVSELGETLPPKSTWIAPKVPYGLILHQHKNPTNDENH